MDKNCTGNDNNSLCRPNFSVRHAGPHGTCKHGNFVNFLKMECVSMDSKINGNNKINLFYYPWCQIFAIKQWSQDAFRVNSTPKVRQALQNAMPRG